MSFDTWSAGKTPPEAAPLSAADRRARHYRHLAAWVAQGWLAMFYLAAGYAKITQPREMLAVLMTWPGQLDPGIVQSIGWAEAALAIGVVAPLSAWPALRIPFFLSTGALLLNAGFMSGYHIVQDDLGLAFVNGGLVGLTIVVFWGRSGRPDGGTPS